MLFWLLQEMLYTQTSLSLNVCMKTHTFHRGQYRHKSASPWHHRSQVERISPSPMPPAIPRQAKQAGNGMAG